jgi:competence protein ComEC
MIAWLLREFRQQLTFRRVAVSVAVGLALLAAVIWQLPDGQLHLVFCDVGQGDAALLVKGGTQILIDGGPDDRVLDCLAGHLPFWDRQIEMVLLSHPQADHMNGLLTVLERYTVNYFGWTADSNTTPEYRRLLSLLRENVRLRKTKIIRLGAGDRISVAGLTGLVVWPEKSEKDPTDSVISALSAEELSGGSANQTTVVSNQATATDSPVGVTGGSGSGENAQSLVILINDGSFRALFTGDGDSTIDDGLLKNLDGQSVTVLKYPHHGSRTGATREFLEAIQPQLAVIPVGKNNPYGHPAPATLDLLRLLKIRYFRTDLDGAIEVVTDGRGWRVSAERGNGKGN